MSLPLWHGPWDGHKLLCKIGKAISQCYREKEKMWERLGSIGAGDCNSQGKFIEKVRNEPILEEGKGLAKRHCSSLAMLPGTRNIKSLGLDFFTCTMGY